MVGVDLINDNLQPSLQELDSSTQLRVLPDQDVPQTWTASRRSGYQRLVKPVMDRVGAAVALLVAAPFMAVIAVAVLRGLGRPIIFRQVRVGRNGKPFTVYKFCTMDADRRSEKVDIDGDDRRVTHKSESDPRLNPLGRILRKWSLDELPQLWNVLRGDMSLVGPRPELPSIVEGFAPWQHERHAVKPGLTGFWQVYARGDGLLMHEHTSLDVAYVRRIGLLTDMKILLLTVPAVVGFRKGI